MQALGTDLMLVCSNVSPAALGGIDRAADGFPRARRARGEARSADRLRGAGLGPACLRSPRRLGDRAARRSSGDRAHPRFLPHAGAEDRPGFDPPHSRRPHLPRAGRRRAAARHGPPLLEPALPQHARTGRTRRHGLPRRRRGDRLSRLPLARDLQRPVPRRLGEAGRGRRTAIADRRRGPRRAGRPAPAAACDRRRSRRSRARSASSSSNLPSTKRAAPSSADVFAALGFRKAGRHVSKDVEWWRQGAINLVINSEREGFAHASYITHGPSVCALGLRVEDAQAAMARARALLAQPFSQAVGPGRAGAARRSAGSAEACSTSPTRRARCRASGRSSSVRIADRRRTSPTGRCSRSTTSRSRWNTTRCSPGCSSTPRSSRWSARRRSTSPTPPASCAARSSKTANGTVRIALNGAQSHRTLSGRFLSEFFGSGVQHIAFASARHFRIGGASAGERRRSPSDTRQLLRRPRGAVRARSGAPRQAQGSLASSTTATTSGEYLQLYTAAVRRSLLLRDRGAEERLSRLRRRQCSDPPRRPVARSSAGPLATALV